MSRKLLNEELNRLTTEEYKDAEKLPIVVVLDNVRSLNNIGSVFRTSDAFRLSKIYLCGITATPPHREIHKTALGAEESVDWEYFEETTDAVQALKTKGTRFYPWNKWRTVFLWNNSPSKADENMLSSSETR